MPGATTSITPGLPDVAKQITEPLLTCEAVFAEAAFDLESSTYVLSLVEDELLKMSLDCSRHIPQLQELARRYADRKPGLADLCLVRMSEIYPRRTVITVDGATSEFTDNKRETIPLLCPPRHN